MPAFKLGKYFVKQFQIILELQPPGTRKKGLYPFPDFLCLLIDTLVVIGVMIRNNLCQFPETACKLLCPGASVVQFALNVGVLSENLLF